MVDQEIISRFAKNPPLEDELFYMIPQKGVRHSVLQPEVKHNATWDYIITPEGKHFFSVCAEGNYAEFAHLYEFMPDTGQFRICFKLDDVIVTYPRAIRPSKLHESFSMLPDGRIIMTTHTTATAPNHPVWTPLGYYSHQWEGYQGSNILIYDPKTNKVEDMGIPVPRVSIYGGAYAQETDAYYFGCYTKGHVYRFDLSNRHVKDYGQAAEIGSFRFITGPDGNVYFSTKSGAFFRVNTKQDRIDDLGIQFPIYDDNPYTLVHNQMTFTAIGPDNCLYLCAAYGNQLLKYDFQNNTIKKAGRFAPKALRMADDAQGGDQTCGLSFDKYNVLWYVCRGYLSSWDIFNGGAPQNHGLMGSAARRIGYVPAAYIRDDVLYATDSNHFFDPPGIISVRLDVQREGLKPDVKCADPIQYVYYKNGVEQFEGDLAAAGKKIYGDWDLAMRTASDFMENNPMVFSTPRHFLTKIWKLVPIDESGVRRVWYDADGKVHALCGDELSHHIVLKEGQVISVDAETVTPPEEQDAESLFHGLKLPCHPGRQFIAKASAWAELSGGRKIVGTMDGMLAIISENKKVFSLGPCAPHGPVHQIVSTTDGSAAYGVAGDPLDIGTVFSYNDETGLAIHGRVYTNSSHSVGGLGASCEPCCIALSADDKKLVIGAKDRMGCVYEYDLTEGIKLVYLD